MYVYLMYICIQIKTICLAQFPMDSDTTAVGSKTCSSLVRTIEICLTILFRNDLI